MRWRAFLVTLPLESELHCGAGMIGNVLRTRHYVLGRALWGSLTARLTRMWHERPRPDDYARTGEFVRDGLVFGCFFPRVGSTLLNPRWEKDGLRYGGLAPDVFEFQLLVGRASTAIDPEFCSAGEGSLHEVEALRTAVVPITEGAREGPVSLEGNLFVGESADIGVSDGGVSIRGVPLVDLLSGLQIGGERAYGYGRLGKATISTAGNSFHGHQLILGADVRVTLSEGEPFPAPVKFDPRILCLTGEIEAVVGREWRETEQLGAGEHISECLICWSPGAVFQTGRQLRLGPYGIWEAV